MKEIREQYTLVQTEGIHTALKIVLCGSIEGTYKKQFIVVFQLKVTDLYRLYNPEEQVVTEP